MIAPMFGTVSWPARVLHEQCNYSAMRALQSIDAFRPLPNDYMGKYVDVTFDFDLSLSQ